MSIRQDDMVLVKSDEASAVVLEVGGGKVKVVTDAAEVRTLDINEVQSFDAELYQIAIELAVTL